MKSEDAKTVVRHAAAGGSYDDVSALKTRYDKSRVVYMHHVSAFTSRAPIHSNCEDLVRGLQELELHHSGLKAHGGDTLGQFLTATTVLLMDSSCAMHWADYTSNRKEPPDLKTIRRFFEHRILTLQSNPHTARKIAKPPQASQPAFKQKDKPKSTVYHARESTYDPSCPASHKIYDCPSFKEWTLNKRLSTVRKKSMCFNCLGRGHSSDSCRSKRTCKDCSGKHHTLLHNLNQTSETQVTCAQGRVVHKGHTYQFPRTVVATVTVGTIQQRTRALLDPGSTISLITSCLAQSLRAPKMRATKEISGLTGKLTSNYEVKVELSAAITGGKSVIRANVIDSISKAFLWQTLRWGSRVD